MQWIKEALCPRTVYKKKQATLLGFLPEQAWLVIAYWQSYKSVWKFRSGWKCDEAC